MEALTKQQLLALNQIGIIPGPRESMAEFSKRADYCLSLKQHLAEKLQTELGPSEEIPPAVLEGGFAKTSTLYGFKPHWIPVFFSNYQLTPWHGGCAWIFQLSEDSPTSALLQMRRAFRNSPRYLGIYHRDELIAHELAHAGRMAFEEPQFEEALACRTSSSGWRKWCGPIVQSSWESTLFVLTLGLLFIIDIFLITVYGNDAYMDVMWLKLVPTSMIALAFLRLWRRQRHFDKCLKKLTSFLDDQRAWAAIYRLTDNEIRAFGKMNREEIQKYAHEQAASSLRWQVILEAYFNS